MTGNDDRRVVVHLTDAEAFAEDIAGHVGGRLQAVALLRAAVAHLLREAGTHVG